MLSNYQCELAEFFVPCEDYDYYTSFEEAIEKTQYYLDHDNIRREIAHNAFEKVAELYNYPRRLNEMLNIVFNH